MIHKIYGAASVLAYLRYKSAFINISVPDITAPFPACDPTNCDVLLTVHLSIILVIDQLNAHILVL